MLLGFFIPVPERPQNLLAMYVKGQEHQERPTNEKELGRYWLHKDLGVPGEEGK